MKFYCTNGVWHKGDSKPIPTFPIQGHYRQTEYVPLEVAQEAYKEYSAQFGSSQSLARLGERGGFGAAEIAILLYERIKRIEQEQASKGAKETR